MPKILCNSVLIKQTFSIFFSLSNLIVPGSGIDYKMIFCFRSGLLSEKTSGRVWLQKTDYLLGSVNCLSGLFEFGKTLNKML